MSYSFSFSIITPVFNEAPIIKRALLQNISVLESTNVEYEIIVVNDGSTDGSLEILRNEFAQNRKVKIIHHGINKGFGGTIKTGIENATNTYIFCVPADSPLTDEILFAFKESCLKADVVVSYRIVRLGYTLRMRIASWVYHLLIENLFDIHFVDFNWMHLYHRKIFEKNKIAIESKGVFMLAEVLIKAQHSGCTFCEIPVAQSERITGTPSASKFSVILKTLYEMVAFKWHNKY